MYEVANGRTSDYAPLMEALGQYSARIHDARILHLDYTPGNILWKQDSHGLYHFCLVDINRMRFNKEVGMLKGCENLKKMWGSKELISIMVRSYAVARGFDANTCEEVVMRLRRNFWRHYKNKDGLPFNIEL
jgi:tRNA A-37 threonylcarbamoyl transferase component Bud32